MPIWLEVILEIIKITIPALIVFLTVFYMQKHFWQAQNQKQILNVKQKQNSISLPLRLQAYERLTMLCERLYIPSLVLRLRNEEMTTNDLKISLMLSIQQEFEYNVTQQIYVSQQLWDILKVVRANTLNVISLLAEPLESNANARKYAQVLLEKFEQGDPTGLDTALRAIKDEASLLM